MFLLINNLNSPDNDDIDTAATTNTKSNIKTNDTTKEEDFIINIIPYLTITEKNKDEIEIKECETEEIITHHESEKILLLNHKPFENLSITVDNQVVLRDDEDEESFLETIANQLNKRVYFKKKLKKKTKKYYTKLFFNDKSFITLSYVIHVSFLKKNTIIHLSDTKGNLIFCLSAGYYLKLSTNKQKTSRFRVLAQLFKHFYKKNTELYGSSKNSTTTLSTPKAHPRYNESPRHSVIKSSFEANSQIIPISLRTLHVNKNFLKLIIKKLKTKTNFTIKLIDQYNFHPHNGCRLKKRRRVKLRKKTGYQRSKPFFFSIKKKTKLYYHRHRKFYTSNYYGLSKFIFNKRRQQLPLFKKLKRINGKSYKKKQKNIKKKSKVYKKVPVVRNRREKFYNYSAVHFKTKRTVHPNKSRSTEKKNKSLINKK